MVCKLVLVLVALLCFVRIILISLYYDEMLTLKISMILFPRRLLSRFLILGKLLLSFLLVILTRTNFTCLYLCVYLKETSETRPDKTHQVFIPLQRIQTENTQYNIMQLGESKYEEKPFLLPSSSSSLLMMMMIVIMKTMVM